MRVEEDFGLKPCPFCGKEAVLHAKTIQRAADCMIPISILGVDVYETRTDTTVTVGCSDDACLGRAHDPNTISFWDITSAVEAWNTRAERTCKNRDADIYPGGMVFVCSACEGMSTDGQPSYCPNCGAKVVEE